MAQFQPFTKAGGKETAEHRIGYAPYTCIGEEYTHKRSRGSVWLERSTDNRKVPSSNLGGTKEPLSFFFQKKERPSGSKKEKMCHQRWHLREGRVDKGGNRRCLPLYREVPSSNLGGTNSSAQPQWGSPIIGWFRKTVGPVISLAVGWAIRKTMGETVVRYPSGSSDRGY